MFRWAEPKKPVSVRLPADLQAAVKSAAPLRRKNVEQAYVAALTEWLEGARENVSELSTRQPSEPITPEESKTAPAKRSLDELPAELHDLMRHWSDPEFRACILGIGHIWDVGDADVKDSIRRNVRTFGRIKALGATGEGRSPEEEGSRGAIEGIRRVVEDADRDYPEDTEDEGPAGTATPSSGNVPPVGKGPVRKDGKRRRG